MYEAFGNSVSLHHQGVGNHHLKKLSVLIGPIFFFFLVTLCGLEDLSSLNKEPLTPAVEGWSPNH